MNPIEITEVAFHALFKPLKNHLNPHASFDFGDGFGTMFETFDHEAAFVRRQNADRIWTVVDGDDGLEISSGFNLVNRIGHMVTEQPVPQGTQITVPLETLRLADVPTIAISVRGGLVQEVGCSHEADLIVIDLDTAPGDQHCFVVPTNTGTQGVHVYRLPATPISGLAETDLVRAMQIFHGEEAGHET